jgi:hypothetical protein
LAKLGVHLVATINGCVDFLGALAEVDCICYAIVDVVDAVVVVLEDHMQRLQGTGRLLRGRGPGAHPRRLTLV